MMLPSCRERTGAPSEEPLSRCHDGHRVRTRPGPCRLRATTTRAARWMRERSGRVAAVVLLACTGVPSLAADTFVRLEGSSSLRLSGPWWFGHIDKFDSVPRTGDVDRFGRLAEGEFSWESPGADAATPHVSEDRGEQVVGGVGWTGHSAGSNYSMHARFSRYFDPMQKTHDRRHQRRLRYSLESRVGRSDRRRPHRGRGGLRRRLQHHPGAKPCLRHEVAGMAARSPSEPARDGARSGEGLRETTDEGRTPDSSEDRVRSRTADRRYACRPTPGFRARHPAPCHGRCRVGRNVSSRPASTT